MRVRPTKSKKDGTILYAYGLQKYTTSYTWKWWGFYANINCDGVKCVRTDLIYAEVVIGSTGIFAGIMTCGLALGASAISSVAVANMIRECSYSIDLNTGATLTCLGGTDSAELVAVNSWA